jgi:hypothetical protein
LQARLKIDNFTGADQLSDGMGGMRLMKEVFERSGVSGLVGEFALSQPGSNREYCFTAFPLNSLQSTYSSI